MESSPTRPETPAVLPPAVATFLEHVELVERLKIGYAAQAVMLKAQAEKIGELQRAVACPHDRLKAIEEGLAELTNHVFGCRGS